jgi:hypothetical protein
MSKITAEGYEIETERTSDGDGNTFETFFAYTEFGNPVVAVSLQTLLEALRREEAAYAEKTPEEQFTLELARLIDHAKDNNRHYAKWRQLFIDRWGPMGRPLAAKTETIAPVEVEKNPVLCQVADCSQRRLSVSTVCANHCCSEVTCTTPCKEGKHACAQHACRKDGCKKTRLPGVLFCDTHNAQSACSTCGTWSYDYDWHCQC